MPNFETGLISDFSDGGVVSANPDARREAGVPLTRVLRETAGAVSRPVMWAMELLAIAGLVFCLRLLTVVHQGPEAAALGIAAIYFSGSAGLGAYLLIRFDSAKSKAGL